MDPKTLPNVAEVGQAAQAFGTAVSDMWKSMSGLSLPMDAMSRLQADYVSQAAQMWNDSLTRFQKDGKAAAPVGDKRFAGQAWIDNPVAAMAAQSYLLNARTLMQMAEAVQGDAKTKARVRFAVQQWIDAASPANCLALNADALAKALETRGESLAQGLQQLVKDVQQGHVSQTDESAFEVGRNVAVSEGAVVYENELFQLIEYKPLTAKVYERPMLFVPPCINKFYILDLQPENSVIRYTVEQGHRVFVISWRNPDASLVGRTWDDYIEHGPIEAIEVVKAIAGSDEINTLGFCVGGTLLTTALAVLAARGENPAKSMTLLTTLLDFEDTGVLDVFIDEAAVQLREMTIGADAPTGPGMLKGKDLATTFSFLRPNDLVWNYVVGNYLKGEAPPPFDLLYWNGDSTNLPGPMYCWYLRHTYLQNELKQPGKLKVCGVSLDVTKIKNPVFIYASREDHIVPWKAAYASTGVLKGAKDQTFVLGASGHIAGVINPASKNKRSHWTNAKRPADADAWFDTATEQPGSWWPVWSGWLSGHGGRQVAAPKGYGNRQHPAIEPAPGRYVRQKA
ncbi:class I poly(R)-hydroxyalkanoic acid synthase [Aquabacterium sp. OR-4]|uniref:class I poly(R)-hydroxyalkanoic acid synthase n=1 Tax=Aquabacterium sp. OR-4 TaxID=2978127 RepID=UPI0021B4B30C|nr:class I poly(R)-hydroxyalkanoic acid synthase [Aquabacterium sp. OR-4]MDT7835143.1 class I poly(R)-hydroxyalkanoic acid synthase [Aquabacterium sp. OR-4]